MSELSQRGAPQDFQCTAVGTISHAWLEDPGDGTLNPVIVSPFIDAYGFAFRASDAFGTTNFQTPEVYQKLLYFFNMYQYWRLSKVVVKYTPNTDLYASSGSISQYSSTSSTGFPYVPFYNRMDRLPGSNRAFISITNSYDETAVRSSDLNELMETITSNGGNMYPADRPFEHVIVPQIQQVKQTSANPTSAGYVDNVGNQWIPTRVYSGAGGNTVVRNINVAWYGCKLYLWSPFDGNAAAATGISLLHNYVLGVVTYGVFTYQLYFSFQGPETRSLFSVSDTPDTGSELPSAAMHASLVSTLDPLVPSLINTEFINKPRLVPKTGPSFTPAKRPAPDTDSVDEKQNV